MKKIIYTILIYFLFISCSYSKNLSGFVIDNEKNKFNLQPISKSYKGKTPDISLNNSENIKIIILCKCKLGRRLSVRSGAFPC